MQKGSATAPLHSLLDSLNRLDFSGLDKIWVKWNFAYVFQKYLEDMKTYFGAEPQSVNFVESFDQIRKEINSWVERQTEGKYSASAESFRHAQTDLF